MHTVYFRINIIFVVALLILAACGGEKDSGSAISIAGNNAKAGKDNGIKGNGGTTSNQVGVGGSIAQGGRVASNKNSSTSTDAGTAARGGSTGQVTGGVGTTAAATAGAGGTQLTASDAGDGDNVDVDAGDGTGDYAPCESLNLICFDVIDMFILNPQCFTCNNGLGCQTCDFFQAK
jgi:hypothetical protein